MPFSDYLNNLILEHVVGHTQSINLGGDAYIALATDATTPLKDGTGITEPSGNGYARVLIGIYGQSATLMMDDASAGVMTNSKEIHFPKATGAWGHCTHVIVYDALTGGNMLAWGELTTHIDPVNLSVPIIAVGNISITTS